MATTKAVKKLPSGRLSYRGETFAGYNKPKKNARQVEEKRGFG